MKFVPRRDRWLSVVIWLSIAALVVAGLSPLFVDGAGVIGGTIILLVCFVFAISMVWLWCGTYYVITKSELFIRSGPFTKSIAFDSITKVKPVRSWVSSAATSSHRVEIEYGKYDVVHVSPLDQEAFIEELRTRCSRVQIEMLPLRRTVP
ncbi:PH domain-containing protein [Paenibacillus sp. SAFN-117]|uniref:PH domain-containing protein n=1 Tax=Paenibacillus sp. SAFN-117 TaxID=3436860 RepID=UPI003F7F0298